MGGIWGYLADFIEFESILTARILLLAVSGILGSYALRKSKPFQTIQ